MLLVKCTLCFYNWSSDLVGDMRLSLVSGLVLGCAIGLSGCTNANNPGQAQATPTPTIAAVPNAVLTLGRLEPEGEVIKLSVPNAQDSRVNQLLVKEGDRVQANQVIAILQGIDRRQAEVEDAEAEVVLRGAELEKAEKGEAKTGQIAAQQATIEKLEAELTSTSRQRQAAIVSAKARLRNAERDYKRKTELVAAGAIARSELDKSQEDLATATATVTEREAELEQTQSTIAASIRQETSKLAEIQEVRPTDVTIARAQLDKAKIQVEQRRANVRDAEVRVPIDGQILKINTRVGEQVNTTQGIVELAQTRQMYAIADIPEIDIGKIYKGQPAVITSEYGGFEGELRGQVTHIGLQVGRKSTQDAAGSTPTTDQNSRVISVKVRINPGDSAKVAKFTAMQVRVKLEVKS
jgi:HlyD family secretion protein